MRINSWRVLWVCLCVQGCVTVSSPHRQGNQGKPQSAELLKASLQTTNTGPESARVLVDLAESYLEETRIRAREAMASNRPVDELELRYLAEQAAATYGVLVQTYPKWPLRPRALFYLGMLMHQLGDEPAADRWRKLLVRRYGDTDEAADVKLSWSSQWAKGNGDPARAIETLKSMLGRPDHLGARAHYWTAWAQRNLGNDTVALTHFQRAAALAKRGGMDIHREALLDSIVLFNGKYPNRSGVDHYRKLAADRGVYLEVLNRLEKRFVQIDQAEGGLGVIRELLRLSDDVERADGRVTLFYRWQVATGYAQLGFEDLALVVKAWDALVRHGKTTPELTQYYGDLALDLCMQMDIHADGNDDSVGQAQVAEVWRLFVSRWPDHEQADEGRLNLARAWDHTENTFQAAEAWSAIAHSDPQGVQGGHKESIARYLKVIEDERQKTKWSLALSGMRRHLKGGLKEAQPKEQAAILYRVARAHDQNGAVEVAYALYAKVAASSPPVPQAVGSGQAMLAIRNAQRNPIEFGETITQLRALPVGALPLMRKELDRLEPLVEGQMRAERVALARRSGHKGFRDLLNGSSSPKDQADVHAAMAMSFRSKGDYASARRSFDAIRKLDPDSESVGVLASQLADDALARGQVLEVAHVYAQAIKAQPALLNEFGPPLANLLDQLGRQEQSAQVWKQLERAAPNHPIASEAVVWARVQTMGEGAAAVEANRFLSQGHQSDRLRGLVLSTEIRSALGELNKYGNSRTATEFSAQTRRFVTVRGLVESYLPFAPIPEALVLLDRLHQETVGLAADARAIEPPSGLSADQAGMLREMLNTNASNLDALAERWRQQCVQAAQTHLVWNPAATRCAKSDSESAQLVVSFSSVRSEKGLMRALEEEPGNEELLGKLAGAFAANGRLGRALVLMDWVVAREPEHAASQRLRADVLWAQGEWVEAVRGYQTALQHGSKTAEQRLQQLERGKDGQAGW